MGGFKTPDIHMPDINLPSINFGGKGGADIDAEVSGPGKPHVDVELDINAPKVKGPEVDISGDVNVDSPSGKKKFGFKMPKIGFGGKAGASGDIDIDVEG